MDDFVRCQKCGLITTPLDVEGGVCPKCRVESGVFTFETIGGLVKGRCGAPSVESAPDPDAGPLFAAVDGGVIKGER